MMNSPWHIHKWCYVPSGRTIVCVYCKARKVFRDGAWKQETRTPGDDDG